MVHQVYVPQYVLSDASVRRWSNGAQDDNKVHGANMGPIWGRQDPGGPHVGPMNVLWQMNKRKAVDFVI